MFEPQPNTLEHFILYAAYAKSIAKQIKANILGMTSHGMLDDAEGVLVDALFISFEKLDTDFEEVIKHCLARSDKADHLVLAVNRTLKEQGL